MDSTGGSFGDSIATPATPTLPLVLQQCNDLVHLREILLTRSLEQQREDSSRLATQTESSNEEYQLVYGQLQEERLKHAETKATLSEEREKVGLAETEANVVGKQLEREQAAFEQAFGLLKTRALADSSKAENVLAKCTALETLCTKKDEELAAKTHEIQQLQKRMEQIQLAHKLEVQELNVRLQQEMYMASKLGGESSTGDPLTQPSRGNKMASHTTKAVSRIKRNTNS